MRQVFYDKDLEESFLRDGFVLVKNFLNAEQCGFLQKEFDRLNTGFEKGFHVTNWSNDFEYREISHQNVTRLMVPVANNLAINYKPVLGCFAVKYPGTESEMGIHQDWSIADESQCHSFSIWCPLVDVNEASNNGVIQFYRGSHNLYQSIRGKNIPYQFKPEQQYILDNHLENVSVNAGDAIFLHHRVVHRSLPNTSQHPRIVAMLAMVPAELPVKQYFMEDGSIKDINCKDDYYVHYVVDTY